MMKNMKEDSLPQHIGFIVDGNRRWARARGLPTLEGHRKGIELVEEVADECFKRGVPYVSFYIFSTENWGRSKEEVAYLMDLVVVNLKKFVKKCQKENIKIAILGTKERLSGKVLQAVEEAERETRDCGKRGTLGLCFNYGGKKEIADAVAKIDGEVTEEKIEQALYHAEIPALDMMVRTSGEQRISGFMLWRVAYAELMFIEKNWPDMTREDVQEILAEFARRNRRFGK